MEIHAKFQLPGFMLNKLFTVILVLISINVLAQNADSTISKFVEYHRLTPAEKIYLHTDKEVYSQGETIWFSTYALDATSHLASGLSKIVYVELIDPENKVLSTLPINISEGSGAGDFLLADSLQVGYIKYEPTRISCRILIQIFSFQSPSN